MREKNKYSKPSKSVSLKKSKNENQKTIVAKNGNKKNYVKYKKAGKNLPNTKTENKIVNKKKEEKPKNIKTQKRPLISKQASPLSKNIKELNSNTIETAKLAHRKKPIFHPKNKSILTNNENYRIKSEISINSNQTLISQNTKENNISNNFQKSMFFQDYFFSTASKSKETISSYFETPSTEENTIKEKKEKRNNILAKKKVSLKLNNKPEITVLERYYKKKKESEKHLLSDLTPIPILKNKKDGENVYPDSKDLLNVKMLRRLEYNDYIKELNKPKPIKPKVKPKPKPKVYDNDKVNEIQRMYKGFQTRKVNQIINRLKISLCSLELFCLILSQVFEFAGKRNSFYLLKLYYFDPFSYISNEIDITDKINIKLAEKYYNFNNFRITKVKQKIIKRTKYISHKKLKKFKKHK